MNKRRKRRRDLERWQKSHIPPLLRSYKYKPGYQYLQYLKLPKQYRYSISANSTTLPHSEWIGD